MQKVLFFAPSCLGDMVVCCLNSHWSHLSCFNNTYKTSITKIHIVREVKDIKVFERERLSLHFCKRNDFWKINIENLMCICIFFFEIIFPLWSATPRNCCCVLRRIEKLCKHYLSFATDNREQTHMKLPQNSLDIFFALSYWLRHWSDSSKHLQ